MMLFPWRSRARALFRTSKAVSVPSRDMRRASCNSCWVARGISRNSGGKRPERGKLDIIAPGNDDDGRGADRNRDECAWLEGRSRLRLHERGYSETLFSSFWARRTRSTEYGARRLGSW